MNINDGVIDFFKKHGLYKEEVFEYIKEHSTMIDYRTDEERLAMGCGLSIKNDKLEAIHVTLPYVYNEITTILSINIIAHAILAYDKMGKRYKKDITYEAIPLMLEKLYVLENPKEESVTYEKYMEKMIESDSTESYKFGLKIQGELLSSYSDDIKETQELVKRLAKKETKKTNN